ncbi:MAG: ABC transporter ATP-binding protein [Sneathiellaceae bacterium]
MTGAAAGTPTLEVTGLVSGYGRVTILHGIGLAMPAGHNIGLFGPNGHGKTTLLRTISGLLRAGSGKISFLGQDITNRKPREIVALGLIHVAQGNQIFPDLTIQEALRLGAYTPRSRAREAENQERVYRIFPRLKERRRQQIRTLSGGERQMASIGVGLMGDPKALILDEPTLGLAPRIKEELGDAIRGISEAGMPLIVVEQDVEFLMELADQLYMINHGEVAAQIRPGEQIDHEEIMAMYFGTSAAGGPPSRGTL